VSDPSLPVEAIDILVSRAIRDPKNPGQMPGRAHQASFRLRSGFVALAALTTERCSCPDVTPVWHASASIWHADAHAGMTSDSRLDRETDAQEIAEVLLRGRGRPQSVWWWNADARIGHIWAHMLLAEGLAVPPSQPWTDTHDLGELYVRRGALAR